MASKEFLEGEKEGQRVGMRVQMFLTSEGTRRFCLIVGCLILGYLAGQSSVTCPAPIDHTNFTEIYSSGYCDGLNIVVDTAEATGGCVCLTDNVTKEIRSGCEAMSR